MYLLRALQAGLSIADLEYISVGMVYDILTENNNDQCEYAVVATDADIEAL